MPAFWLSVLAVVSLFAAPLLGSPQSRKTARAVKQRGAEVGQAAAENGKQLARDGRGKAADLSSTAQESAIQAKHHVNSSVAGASDEASNVAGDAMQHANETASQVASNTSQFSGSAADIMRSRDGIDGSTNSGHGFNNISSSEHQSNPALSMPGNTGGDHFGPVNDGKSQHMVAENDAAAHSVMDRPRGTVA